ARIGDEGVVVGPVAADALGHQQLDHGLDVPDARQVAQCDGTVGEESRGEDWQRGVLVAGRANGALEPVSAVNHEAWHGGRYAVAKPRASGLTWTPMTPGWVGPTVALSLVIIALSFLAIGGASVYLTLT